MSTRWPWVRDCSRPVPVNMVTVSIRPSMRRQMRDPLGWEIPTMSATTVCDMFWRSRTKVISTCLYRPIR